MFFHNQCELATVVVEGAIVLLSPVCAEVLLALGLSVGSSLDTVVSSTMIELSGSFGSFA